MNPSSPPVLFGAGSPPGTLRKRVLFVDDEPAVLEGLKRSLHDRGQQWEMAFVTSGAEALALLEGRLFDVIVSDLRMPEMDGSQLLEQVRALYPGVIRIALSGHVDREAALRASGVVHQYLNKPCNREELVESIERFCASTAILPNETIRRVVGAIGNLPSLPHTASTLINALRQPNITVGEVGVIIAQDVGMTAKVLQLVNAPLFGILCEITSLQSALAFIGLDTLRQLVLSAEVFRSFEPGPPIAGFSLADFEAHSALTARIAARLPVAKSIVPGSVTAALLHDIGKLVLAVRLPEPFERSLRLSREQNRPLQAVEKEVIGACHAEVGAYLLSLWGLSPSIVDAVCRHHSPEKAGPGGDGLDTAGIVHVADALANELSAPGGSCGRPAPGGLNLSYLAARRVADQLPAWRAMAERLVRDELGTVTAPAAETLDAKEEAGAFTWAQSEFLARVSGGLRASANDIMGMAAQLIESDLNPKQRECVLALTKSGEGLVSLIDAVSDFAGRHRRSRATNGPAAPPLAPANRP